MGTTAGTLCLCAVATRLTCLRVHVAGHCGNNSWYSVSMCSNYQVDMFNDTHVAGHCGNDSWYSVSMCSSYQTDLFEGTCCRALWERQLVLCVCVQ